jgi:hypothetical protein
MYLEALGQPVKEVVPAASVMLFELSTDEWETKSIKISFNDTPVSISACAKPELCTSTEFTAFLEKRFDGVSSAAKSCTSNVSLSVARSAQDAFSGVVKLNE